MKIKNKTKQLSIPDKLTIGGIEYSIQRKSKFKDDCSRNWGFHSSYRAEILILDEQDGERLATCTILHTFLHELIHAIDNMYCGNIFSEEQVNKLEDLLFALLSDNELYIGEDRFPDKIRIIGRDYEVIKDYVFEIYKEGSPSVSLSTDDLKIRCTRKQDAPNYEVHKFNLLVVLTSHICNSFFTEEELEKIPFHPFCSGFYQVLKNSNLNKIIREWCK